MIGHALIHVLPAGGFQLETKSEVHSTLDALLASLEPDVELAASFFNTAVKKKPVPPSKDADDRCYCRSLQHHRGHT